MTMVAVTPCDLLFVNGRVVDGCGGDAFEASVAVSAGRIVGVGERASFAPGQEIDVAGLTIAPGFIDAHTHDDVALLNTPDLPFKTSQGVTTVVIGNCGASLAPLALAEGRSPPAPLSELGGGADFRFATFADYLGALRAAPPAVNVAPLVGHTTLRAGCMDRLDRPATAREIANMEQACAEALEAGAIGVSSGLFYPSAFAAPATEVIPLAALAGACGGVYAAHIRDEADHIDAALDEAFAIASAGKAPLIVSHHKLSGPKNFGRARQTLARIAAARTGQPVAFDVYPYDASSTMLNEKSWASASRVLVTWSEPHPECAGMELSAAAEKLGVSEREALDRLSPGGGVYFMMDEGDVQTILKCPEAMIGSDGVPGKEHPHPRLYGTFPRVLGHYARDLGLFSFEEAVRRMTSLPAAQFRLRGRGVIAVGAAADLVLLDPQSVGDRATYDSPKALSAGIEAVYVNGHCVFKNGAPTGARPGQVLSR